MKIVLRGVLCETPEHIKQITDGFREEFGGDFKVLGAFKTLPGQGGEGGRSEVVVEMPDKVIPKAAIHQWHLGGMFSWWDDYVHNNKKIIPAEAMKQFFVSDFKPKCIVGTDGNVFALSGKVRRALLDAGQKDKAEEFSKKLFDCDSYAAAIGLMSDYVELY